MKGTKAQALDQWAKQQGRACIRFDYSGHGESGGNFADGTIGRWLEESCAVFSTFCEGPTIAIGSSMGGWISLLLARELRAGRLRGKAALAGLVLIAPAVDFTEALMWQRFTPEIKKQIEETGSWQRPSEYSDEPYLITRQLIEDGRKHLLLGGLIETGCPVRILQGVKDEDVPWEHAVSLVSRHRARRCGADAGQGRRSPVVAAGGYRAAVGSGRGIQLEHEPSEKVRAKTRWHTRTFRWKRMARSA